MPPFYERTEMPDRTKLPKWAQDELTLAERNLAYWRAKATEGPAESDTFRWEGGSGDAEDTPLGASPVIRLYLGPDWQDCIDVQTRTEGGRKFLRISGRGGNGLVVRPHVSNVIHVEQA